MPSRLRRSSQRPIAIGASAQHPRQLLPCASYIRRLARRAEWKSAHPTSVRLRAITCFRTLAQSLDAKDKQRVAGRDRDPLLAVDLEADRVGPDFAAGLKLPQRLAGLGVERKEIAVEAAAEDQASGRR